jgi:cell wall assembly regulator SMI1
MIRIQETGRTLSEAEVVALERRISCRLPEPYRRFLLEHNGGRPPVNADVIDIEHLPGSEVDVKVFFGIEDPIESCNIDWNLKTFEGRIGDQLLPVACDSFGNLFCISLSPPDYGSVVYCDFDPSWHLGAAIYYRVAPDFDSFLGRIRSLEDN